MPIFCHFSSLIYLCTACGKSAQMHEVKGNGKKAAWVPGGEGAHQKTRALQAGVPAEIVSKLLDHSSVSITLNVYARYSREQIDSAIEKIRY